MKILKKEQNSVYFTITDIRLHRNEIEKFKNLVEEVGETLEISDNDYTYDSLDDFIANNGYKINRLKISSLDTNKLTVASFEITMLRLTIFYKLDYINLREYTDELEERKSTLSKIFKPVNSILLLPLGMTIFFTYVFLKYGFSENSNLKLDSNDYKFLFTVAIIHILIGILFFAYNKYYLGFYLEKSHDTSFKRNKKEVIKNVGFVLLGMFLKYLFDSIAN